MVQIVDLKNNLDQTIRIYDSFYNFDMVVPTNDYDIVYGYFKSTCRTKEIARNFTAFFFRITQETGLPAVTLLQQIQGSNNKLEMNRTIAYYLNSFKSKTSLYGISIIPQANQLVARNIVQ